MGLTKAQIARLSKAIDPNHVEKKQGLSYMAQHEVRAELTRIFGYGNWDTQVESMDLLYETELAKGMPQYPAKGDGRPYYVVCYRACVRLNIRDYQGKHVASFVEYHAEENAPLPNRGEAHAMAITSVESYAMRRAAIGLGDRLGLGLYNEGKIVPLVKGTLQTIDSDSPQFVGQEEGPARATSVDRLQAVVKSGEGE
jgi:recombination DNA repair RAD52 pathway protein